MSAPCPKCGKKVVAAPIWRRVAALPLIAGGIVFAIPTVGISLVATVYGVFMREPSCERCG